MYMQISLVLFVSKAIAILAVNVILFHTFFLYVGWFLSWNFNCRLKDNKKINWLILFTVDAFTYILNIYVWLNLCMSTFLSDAGNIFSITFQKNQQQFKRTCSFFKFLSFFLLTPSLKMMSLHLLFPRRAPFFQCNTDNFISPKFLAFTNFSHIINYFFIWNPKAFWHVKRTTSNNYFRKDELTFTCIQVIHSQESLNVVNSHQDSLKIVKKIVFVIDIAKYMSVVKVSGSVIQSIFKSCEKDATTNSGA